MIRKMSERKIKEEEFKWWERPNKIVWTINAEYEEEIYDAMKELDETDDRQNWFVTKDISLYSCTIIIPCSSLSHRFSI